MKKKWLIAFALIALIGYNVPVRTYAVSAQSFIVTEATTGRILAGSNIHARLPIASTTKVMTAIVALEKAPLHKKIKISKDAVGITGSSIYLKEGETLTLEELLYGLMLASGNDAAAAIAIGTAGSEEKFVEWMNQKARELGAEDTHFMNPHGLHADGHYSSAADMAAICAYAMKNPVFVQIASTIDKRVTGENGPETRFLHNKNKILSIFKGGNGIKIGYTRAAGRCLCASAKRDDMQLICVVLNDGDWFKDAAALMDAAFAKYSMQPVVVKNQLCANIPVENGKTPTVEAVAEETFLYPLAKGEVPHTVSRMVSTVKAPGEKGAHLGQIEIYLGEKQIGTANIVAAQNTERLKPPGLFERIKEWFNK